ncbi:MAG TPA: FAD-dependent oxidoreductase, partial [Solirubrobacteraceae bacterium]
MSTATTQPPEERVKVAILGGGCGGLAAAWHLTATPAMRNRFEVTVYERRWQLGGKGASGRAPHASGAAGRGQRIEEHGLHIWFGFYDHAFRMLRGAYEESGLSAGDDWWRVPFEKCDSLCLYEQRENGDWSRHEISLPRRGGSDRGPPTEPRRPPLGRAIARSTRLLANGLRAELAPGLRRRGPGSDRGDGDLHAASSILDELAVELDRIDSPLALDADGASGDTARGRRRFAAIPLRGTREAALDPLLNRLVQRVRELQRELPRETSDRIHLWRGVLELVAASLAGIVRDDVLWRGFDTIDQEDLREWLARHGASPETLASSPVLRGLYDLTFAYREGDKQRPSLAAGKGVQSLLMMINYEGSFMWRMRAGMGDVVFAPLYLALRKRGVRFQFFSRVTAIRLMPGRPLIDAIDLTREATVAAGVERYEPIERIGDWWCWPAAPYEDQLSDREPRAVTLRRGIDFDDVVLAIPVGALGDVCEELADTNPRFRQMLEGAETVQTKACQVWLTRPIDELRARPGGNRLDPPSTAHAEPFDTYCDMSHLLPVEGYGGDDGPKAVAYFCSVLPDAVAGAGAQEVVRAGALRYLEREAAAIWPGALDHGAFDWSVVFDPLDRRGPDRLGAQHLRANVEGTDRYVTTPAGSVDSRLEPGASGFENLALAGDWTRSGIDGGCVEGAVISGERAAEATIARQSRPAPRLPQLGTYVDYGALATAPGPLLCERARLYCFFVQADRDRVQRLCDRVFKEPTGGALRYRVPRLLPVVLTFVTIAGLRSLHPAHADRASASEPEAAIWVPTIAQRFRSGRYVDEHLAIFMPYLWVDDPIAFASGREVYGFAKTQGWMRRLGDPRADDRLAARVAAPDPPEELTLDVYGVAEYGGSSELTRTRLITIQGGGGARRGPSGEGRTG